MSRGKTLLSAIRYCVPNAGTLFTGKESVVVVVSWIRIPSPTAFKLAATTKQTQIVVLTTRLPVFASLLTRIPKNSSPPNSIRFEQSEDLPARCVQLDNARNKRHLTVHAGGRFSSCSRESNCASTTVVWPETMVAVKVWLGDGAPSLSLQRATINCISPGGRFLFTQTSCSSEKKLCKKHASFDRT